MPLTSLASRLPGIETVRRWSQTLAVLDAILSPDWHYRYFSFDSHWAPNEQMASMSNGSGDEYSIIFGPVGAFVRGFDHESEMSPYAHSPTAVWPGVIEELPAEFEEFVREPAFCYDGVPRATVCLWRRSDDALWRHGPVSLPAGSDDPDGADWLFEVLDGQPETYRRYALDYFEQDVDPLAIRHIYEHQALTAEVLAVLNPSLALADLASDLAEIGYGAVDLD